MDWLGISENEFIELINPHRDRSVWDLDTEGDWFLKDSVLDLKLSSVSENELEVVDPREYKLTELLEDESSSNEYILLGRTYMDQRNFKAKEG